MKRYVFDIETDKTANEVGGWINKHRMGIAVLCMKDLDSGDEVVFSDEYDGAKKLSYLYDRIYGNTLIGHNILAFDWRLVLQQFIDEKRDVTVPVNLIDTKVARLSLGDISMGTFGTQKMMDGALAPIEWRKGMGAKKKVVEYCMDDVRKTYDAFNYGLEHGYVCYIKKGKKGRIDVDWKDKLGRAPKIMWPECLGRFEVAKESWQCGRCAFKLICKRRSI
jgi:DEAD/DEAH box helicase domain-containing protein